MTDHYIDSEGIHVLTALTLIVAVQFEDERLEERALDKISMRYSRGEVTRLDAALERIIVLEGYSAACQAARRKFAART